MKFAIWLLVGLLLAFSAGFFAAAFAVSRFGGESTVSEVQSPERLMQQLVDLTNRERVAHDLAPLKLRHGLKDAALWLARDMADKGYLGHTDSTGRDFDTRLQSFGYTNASDLAENVAGGAASPAEVLAEWMNSPVHRANLLNPRVREIGVGYAIKRTKPPQRYWVEDFGSRIGAYPIIINNEAARTVTPAVELYVHGCLNDQETNGNPAGRLSQSPSSAHCPLQMRLSNNGLSWTPWEPYTPTRVWTLLPGTGIRQVNVELRGDGRTYRANDTIELNPVQGDAGGQPMSGNIRRK